jgi:hypothetical protein
LGVKSVSTTPASLILHHSLISLSTGLSVISQLLVDVVVRSATLSADSVKPPELNTAASDVWRCELAKVRDGTTSTSAVQKGR